MKEVEATLIILSERPRAVVDDIAALTSVASYRLLSQGSRAIHDFHVDTSDRALRRTGLSLRVREIDSIPYLTLKGPPLHIGPGLVERLEIEALWSEEALSRVAKELAHQSIRLWPTLPVLDGDYPLDVMAGLGLLTIQHRENHRQVKNVVKMDTASGPALAELAIDSVVYHLAPQKVRHYEIEIEAKAEGGLQAVQDITESLVEAYPIKLLKWGHDKLSTGRAVQELLSSGGLAGLLDSDRNLKPAAYAEIHSLLEANPHPEMRDAH
jgi:inorganic triphosphatase YgiF